MKNDIKYLIVPDVHGRSFWQRPVEECLSGSDCKIVFLGDYLDPYPYEWEDADTSPALARVKCRSVALDRFKQILDLKRKYPDRVTLLLGNHDCGYAIGSDICTSRMDYGNAQEITYLFQDNRNLFQLVLSSEIAGRRFLFSHAGILKGWYRQLDQDQLDPEMVLNNAWWTEDYRVLDLLADYDRWRGGWSGFQYGSPVWSDIRSWEDVSEEETFGFNIVGHTQLKDRPVVLDQIACLDCRRVFYLDGDGRLHEYDSGDILQKSSYQDEDW